MFNIFETYNKAKDVFVRPKFYFYFGLWRNDPNLPVWRRGPIIKFGKNCSYEQDEGQWYGAWASHTHWKNNYLNNCTWFGKLWRKFIKPTYTLPIWLSFHIFDNDVMWKSKWNEYRYEFPPHFTIVFFGLSFSIILSNPFGKDDFHCDDHYWECLLTYVYEKYTIEELFNEMGFWTNRNDLEYSSLQPEYLKDPYKSECIKLIEKWKTLKKP